MKNMANCNTNSQERMFGRRDLDFEKGQELLALLNELAEEKQATPAQISLAWMLCKKPFIIPIPGSRKPERLKENFGAADIILTAEEIAAIDRKLDTMEIPVFGGH